MNISIRTECVKDYHQIAEVNARAFYRDSFIDEVVLVDILRRSEYFDPELSLVAENNGRIVGHALFNPYRMRLQGQPIQAVLLAPIAVHPDYQRQGIGKVLMDEGHRRIHEKGYAFSFLYGHDSYYPRFGYQTKMFGTCHLIFERSRIAYPPVELVERQVNSADLETLQAMWLIWFHDVDLAVQPGRSLVDWMSHSVNIRTSTILLGDEIIGFLRYHVNQPEKVLLFLARDENASALLLAWLNEKTKHSTVQVLKIPVHPDSAAAKKWLPIPWQAEVVGWDAGMIKIIDPENKLIQAYCAEVAAGKRKPGLVSLPPFFELV